MSKLVRFTLLLGAALATASLHGQAVSTASRLANLQVGATFSVAKPDYTESVYNLTQPTNGEFNWHGYGIYADLDLRHHLGLEFDFHQLSGPDPVLYERTFEVGCRYVFPIRRFVPYGKAMAGRGIFNFAATNASGQSEQIANLSYDTQTLGGGLV